MRKHVLSILRQRLWDLILPCQDLLVKFGSLGILERKTSTEHGIENDARTPDIHHDSLITILALNHLWSSIARRPTGGLQSLL